MTRFILLVLCVFFGACAPSALPVEREAQPVEIERQPVEANASTVKVARVIDGDTIEIEGGERVRLLCVDTPERGEKGYAEATEFLRKYVEGREVELEADPEHDGRDFFGRLLRYVYVKHRQMSIFSGGVERRVKINVNVEIVRAGHSVYWTKYGASSLHDSAFRDAVRDAE